MNDGLVDLAFGSHEGCSLSPRTAGTDRLIKAERSCTICAPTYTIPIGTARVISQRDVYKRPQRYEGEMPSDKGADGCGVPPATQSALGSMRPPGAQQAVCHTEKRVCANCSDRLVPAYAFYFSGPTLFKSNNPESGLSAAAALSSPHLPFR